MNLKPSGLSGEPLQLSDVQSRVGGFWAERAAWNCDMLELKSRVSVVSWIVARGERNGNAIAKGSAASGSKSWMKRMVGRICDVCVELELRRPWARCGEEEGEK